MEFYYFLLILLVVFYITLLSLFMVGRNDEKKMQEFMEQHEKTWGYFNRTMAKYRCKNCIHGFVYFKILNLWWCNKRKIIVKPEQKGCEYLEKVVGDD